MLHALRVIHDFMKEKMAIEANGNANHILKDHMSPGGIMDSIVDDIGDRRACKEVIILEILNLRSINKYLSVLVKC